MLAMGGDQTPYNSYLSHFSNQATVLTLYVCLNSGEFGKIISSKA
jgi:hypothetical protein